MNKHYRVEIHPAALDEADAAVRWYRERNDAAAEALVEEIDRAVSLISESPERWFAHMPGTRRFLLRRYPFSIIYRMSADTILIVAVAHGRRKPDYWRPR